MFPRALANGKDNTSLQKVDKNDIKTRDHSQIYVQLQKYMRVLCFNRYRRLKMKKTGKNPKEQEY